MCCLFGFHDYGHNLTRKQRTILLKTLAIACEERGTDATGIAYNTNGIQHIYKRPLAARKMWFRVPKKSAVVMGHTRMTTQGSEKKNQNNHPFRGCVNGQRFSLAHNGILNNDGLLRAQLHLPETQIETDSYIAVQLLEHFGSLDCNSLQHMAEQLEGTFTFTLLTDQDKLYFIKGNNPIFLYHFKELELYVYASTEQILVAALMQLPFRLGSFHKVELVSGEILCIDSGGNMSRSHFDTSRMDYGYVWMWPSEERMYRRTLEDNFAGDSDYLEDLISVAACFGLYEEDIEEMLRDGITPEEIEEYLYCG